MAKINTLGAVTVGDGANPRAWTGKAIEALEGGEFVVYSGAANTVGSDASSFITEDVTVTLATSSPVNGLVIKSAASGALCSYVRRGDYLMRAAGTVVGGQNVQLISGAVPGVGPLSSGTSPAVGNQAIGRAVTPSASGTSNYTLVSLNL